MKSRVCLPVPSNTNNSRNDLQSQSLAGPWVADGGQKIGPGFHCSPLYRAPLGYEVSLMCEFIVDIMKPGLWAWPHRSGYLGQPG